MKRLINRLLSLLGFIKWHVKPGHEVKLAFVHKGVEYFQMVGGPDNYAQRYFALLDTMDAMGYRVDSEYLDRFQELIDYYVNKGDLAQVAICNQHLKDRRKYLLNAELIYSLASVWFFDKNENVYEYNPSYAAEKINRWRGDAELMQNFYMTPLAEFMPLNDSLRKNMQKYLLGANAEEKMILEGHLSRISKGDGPKDLISSIKSRVAQLQVGE